MHYPHFDGRSPESDELKVLAVGYSVAVCRAVQHGLGTAGENISSEQLRLSSQVSPVKAFSIIRSVVAHGMIALLRLQYAAVPFLGLHEVRAGSAHHRYTASTLDHDLLLFCFSRVGYLGHRSGFGCRFAMRTDPLDYGPNCGCPVYRPVHCACSSTICRHTTRCSTGCPASSDGPRSPNLSR